MFRILNQLIATISIITFLATSSHAMFIQPDWLDPTNPSVGTNRYAYSHNDPVNKMDPGGNEAVTAIGVISSIVAGLLAWSVDNAIDMSDDDQLNGSRGLGISSGIIESYNGILGDNSVHNESNNGERGDEGGSISAPDPTPETEEENNTKTAEKGKSKTSFDKGGNPHHVDEKGNIQPGYHPDDLTTGTEDVRGHRNPRDGKYSGWKAFDNIQDVLDIIFGG